MKLKKVHLIKIAILIKIDDVLPIHKRILRNKGIKMKT